MHLIGSEPTEISGAIACPITYLPTWDRILVRKHSDKEQTAKGLFLPGNFQGALTEGTVLAVGPGRMSDAGIRVPSGFEVGQVVLFSDQSALGFDHDQPEQVMIAAQAILAVKA